MKKHNLSRADRRIHWKFGWPYYALKQGNRAERRRAFRDSWKNHLVG